MMSEEQLTNVLKNQFGFDSFRDGQLEVIQAVLDHRHTLAVLPTGAGKTLLYQLPSHILSGSILIVSPLLALMQDQVARLRMQGHKDVVMLSSLQTPQQRQASLQHLDRYKFIFASPEVLTAEPVRQGLLRIQLDLLVVDEAHCVSQWGPDFRPEYLKLKNLIQQLQFPTVLMLTATAPKKVQDDIIDKLGLAEQNVKRIIKSVNRSNIYLAREVLDNEHLKNERLLELLNQLKGNGVIYFSSRKQASEVAAFLKENQITAEAYHAGIDSLSRYKLLHQFMSNQIRIICATSAFGMGIDKNDIRFVIHYHVPANLESYVQEIGRAGRDGQQSLAILLYARGDEQIQRNLNDLTLPSSAVIEDVIDHKIQTNQLGDAGELLQFYLDDGWSKADINSAYENRNQRFEEKLLKMMNYLHDDMCLRAQIMQYFDELPIKHSDWCCNVRDPRISAEIVSEVNDLTGDEAMKPVRLTWQEQINQLFFVKS